MTNMLLRARWGLAAILTCGAVLMLPVADVAAQEPGAGTAVKVGRPTWDTNWFQTAIYVKALERLGYDVGSPVTLDNPALFQSLAQGDLHFETGGWFPLHNTYLERVGDQVSLVGYVVEKGALQGYLIDKKTAEEHNITNLEDFKNPEIAKLFDSDNNGKANLVACPPGWGCELVITHQLDAYDLRDHVEPIKAQYAASMADALSRYRAGEPIFYYTWTPNWTVGLLKPGEDVVWLEVPFASLPEDQAELEEFTTVSGVEGCVAGNDPCNMGWPANDIRVVANAQFLEDNPAAKKLFEVMSIPVQDIFAQNAKMHAGEDSAADIDRHADDWLEQNKDQVDAWLEEARNAAM